MLRVRGSAAAAGELRASQGLAQGKNDSGKSTSSTDKKKENKTP